jgi:hypothetical protein
MAGRQAGEPGLDDRLRDRHLDHRRRRGRLLQLPTAGNTNANLPAAFANYRATGTIAGSSTSANGSYQRLSVTYTADTPGQPALVDQVFTGAEVATPIGGLFVYVATQGTTVAANVNVDDIQHEQAASASAFTTAGPVIYPLFRNLAERYPRGWASRGYEGFAAVPCVDALSALNKILIHDEATQAILNTQPDFYYPLSDGADTGLFLDQSGNGQIPLTPFVSKYGAGTALEPGTAIPLPGQPGATGVQITAVNAGVGGSRPGTALQLARPMPVAVPPASGWAISFACWISFGAVVAAPGDQPAVMFTASNLVGNNIISPLISLVMDTTTLAKLQVSFQTGGSFRTVSFANPFNDGLAHHFAFMIKQDPTNTTVTLWVDGIPDAATQATSIFGYLNVQARTVTLGVEVVGGFVGPFMNGTMAHAAIWNREITDNEIQSMLDAGRFGFDGEISGQRIMRHLQTGGYYGPTRISNEFLSTAMGIPSFSPTIDLLNDTFNTTQAEMGTAWVQPDGVLAFETRQDRWLRLTPSAVIGENAAGGEIPYLEGIVFDHDPDLRVPGRHLDQAGRLHGARRCAERPAGRGGAFYPRQFDGTSDLFEDATAQYLADWVFYSHRAPLTRVAELEFDPWANPDLWPLVLSLEVGQRVTAKRRASSANAGAGLIMSADYFIEKVGTPQLSFKRDEQVWTVTWRCRRSAWAAPRTGRPCSRGSWSTPRTVYWTRRRCWDGEEAVRMADAQQISVGRWREPVLPGYVMDEEALRWARCRPPGSRTRPPEVGEVVGLRMRVYGAVVRAKVLDAEMAPPVDTRPGQEIDWNVWRYVVEDPARGPVVLDEAGNRAVCLVDDPWPNVLLETAEGLRMRTCTREARLPGSPGWLRERE